LIVFDVGKINEITMFEADGHDARRGTNCFAVL